MKQHLLNDGYPLFVLTLERDETRFKSVDAICDYFRTCVESHPCGRFIAIFDHHAHTCALPEGEIAEEILAAKNIIFCFGLTLPSPEILGLRPRSIGVADCVDRFVISFMEAPMPVANAAMEDWALGLRERASAPSDQDLSPSA